MVVKCKCTVAFQLAILTNSDKGLDLIWVNASKVQCFTTICLILGCRNCSGIGVEQESEVGEDV